MLPNELNPIIALALFELLNLGKGISFNWHWINFDKFVKAKSFKANLHLSSKPS